MGTHCLHTAASSAACRRQRVMLQPAAMDNGDGTLLCPLFLRLAACSAKRVAHLSLPFIPPPGLDVFEDEPEMKPGLAQCKNAVIVPHIASATLWTRAGMVRWAGWLGGWLDLLAGIGGVQEKKICGSFVCRWLVAQRPCLQAMHCGPPPHQPHLASSRSPSAPAGHAGGVQRGGHAVGPPGVEQARRAAVCGRSL